jgi:hypothetical protein
VISGPESPGSSRSSFTELFERNKELNSQKYLQNFKYGEDDEDDFDENEFMKN